MTLQAETFLISKRMTPDRLIGRGATYGAHLHDPDVNEIELTNAGWPPGFLIPYFKLTMGREGRGQICRSLA